MAFSCFQSAAAATNGLTDEQSGSAMDFADPKKKNGALGKILLAAGLTALCILILKQSPTFYTPSPLLYVGESTLDPLKYYHNITSNTLGIMEAMAAYNVNTLIYSSTCATYGEPEKMPITEETSQLPINPYGKAKKMAEDIILDFHKNSDMAVMILRYFNVIGSGPEGRLGEAPRPELREHGRISGACFDAARGITIGLKSAALLFNYLQSNTSCKVQCRRRIGHSGRFQRSQIIFPKDQQTHG
ncbi:hypothetical protein SSX86_022861 [Deinandra increscens subsp. villosa]|uniref:NAD-dependent epimerase/dehydratase domain-containing protein n=1 Tax=Deinandra increscens subsp. villosa TaxID=3103831 RepID=A0AAP0GQP2_9ASTR